MRWQNLGWVETRPTNLTRDWLANTKTNQIPSTVVIKTITLLMKNFFSKFGNKILVVFMLIVNFKLTIVIFDKCYWSHSNTAWCGRYLLMIYVWRTRKCIAWTDFHFAMTIAPCHSVLHEASIHFDAAEAKPPPKVAIERTNCQENSFEAILCWTWISDSSGLLKEQTSRLTGPEGVTERHCSRSSCRPLILFARFFPSVPKAKTRWHIANW